MPNKQRQTTITTEDMRTKRMITRVSGVTLGLVAGEDGPESGDAARIPVSFSAGIESVAVTRTANGGDTWTTTDRIGIIMAKAGTDIYTSSGNGILADNIEYAPGPGGHRRTLCRQKGSRPQQHSYRTLFQTCVCQSHPECHSRRRHKYRRHLRPESYQCGDHYRDESQTGHLE